VSYPKLAFKNSPGLKVFQYTFWFSKTIAPFLRANTRAEKFYQHLRSRRITDFCGRRLALAILVKPPLRNFKLS
jgi:hypothetical protein